MDHSCIAGGKVGGSGHNGKVSIHLGEDLAIALLFKPCSSVSKETTCNAEDPSLIPGLGRSPEEGNGNPLQYSCLENPMDRSLAGGSLVPGGNAGLGAVVQAAHGLS